MHQAWYKQRIAEGIGAYRHEEPYMHWHDSLFCDVDPEAIRDVVEDRTPTVATVVGTWERVARTAEIWSDLQTRGMVYRARLFSEMYLCLVYPRETVFIQLAERLSSDSAERCICRSLAHVESDYRHMRNALAHGTFALEASQDFTGIAFADRHWSKCVEFERVELDCMLVLDVLMSAFERTLDQRGAVL